MVPPQPLFSHHPSQHHFPTTITCIFFLHLHNKTSSLAPPLYFCRPQIHLPLPQFLFYLCPSTTKTTDILGSKSNSNLVSRDSLHPCLFKGCWGLRTILLSCFFMRIWSKFLLVACPC